MIDKEEKKDGRGTSLSKRKAREQAVRLTNLDVMVNDREVIQSDAVIGYYAENTPEEEQVIRDSVKTLMPELVTPIMAKIDGKEE